MLKSNHSIRFFVRAFTFYAPLLLALFFIHLTVFTSFSDADSAEGKFLHSSSTLVRRSPNVRTHGSETGSVHHDALQRRAAPKPHTAAANKKTPASSSADAGNIHYQRDFFDLVHKLHLDILPYVSPVMIVLGLIFMIFGFKLIRIILGVAAFGGSMVLCLSFFDIVVHGLSAERQRTVSPSLGYIIAAVVSGLAALFSILFFKLGIFLLGACGGFFCSSIVLSCVHVTNRYAVIGVNAGLALLGGIVVFLLRKTAYIFVTSILGSSMFYFGLDYYLHTGFRERVSLILHGDADKNSKRLTTTTDAHILACAIIIVLIFLTAFVSMLIQTSLSLRSRTKQKSQFTRLKSTEEKSR